MKAHHWKPYAFSLATTGAVIYVLCALFDALFPPYGLIAWLAPSSPWPLSGGPLGVLTGLTMFTAGGFAIGAIYGGAWGFWNARLGGTRRGAKASR